MTKTSPASSLTSAKHVLPVIVLAQFAGTSMWFASNAVLVDLMGVFGMADNAVALCTNAVQLGFIVGTLVFAFSNISDRLIPQNVFLICAICGALFNVFPVFATPWSGWLLVSRFGTGFFLAGIYPVGMKIASDWYREGLGKALGYLVGALVLGTAFPHALRAASATMSWTVVLMAVSMIAVSGALLLKFTVPEGPNRRRGVGFQPRALAMVFKKPAFRSAAFGYFGHMWELYAFWAFVPILLAAYHDTHEALPLTVSFWSFIIIAMGALGCVVGGHLTRRKSSGWVAMISLVISALCCVMLPVFFHLNATVFLGFLCIWGFSVVSDSPQFSTLNARTAPDEWIGSALTAATCIGFSITLVSIQALEWLSSILPIENSFWLLAIGPVWAITETRKLLKRGL